MSERPRRANELGPTGIRLAGNLRRIRASRPMTTEQLAERVTTLGRPMYANTITKIEKRQRRVDVDDLTALAAALQYPLLVALHGKGRDGDDGNMGELVVVLEPLGHH